MKKIIILILVFLFAFSVLAKTAELPAVGLTPDSPFYFLQTWKESIQTFFTFGEENKAKQYLHLAEVRLAEYQKMIEKGKTEIAQKTLDRYEKQLNRALDKVKELKDKGKDVKDLSQKIEDAVSKHLEVLQENLQKVPEQARKGIENAIENSQKQVEKITGKQPQACTEEAKVCPDGTTVGRTGPNCEFAPCPGEEECAGLGKEITPEEYGKGIRCCIGLSEVAPTRFHKPCSPESYTCQNGCSVPPPYETPWVQCNLCGNGICESKYGENKCNCPKDCLKSD